jgi:hypothetical protein
MRRVLLLVGLIIISSPALAQTQANDPQFQASSGPVTLTSALFTAAGVVTGVLIGDYLLGGNMAIRLVGGYAPQMGRMGSMGGMRGFPLGAGLLRPIVLAGSGILGGYVARNLSK